MMVYGAVGFFFLLRYFKYRKPASIFNALMPLGWVFLAMSDLDIWEPDMHGLVQWSGVVIGALLLVSVTSLELKEP